MGFGEELRGLQSLCNTFPEKKKRNWAGIINSIGVIWLYL
ncbi:MAG: hypothetical protein A4E71_02507 [Smithella sp. PtaU1.Bin162]|nr:MAG: hypothetical protein A4E71_02507 [Smithella sp. PtaU1.Bin162]